MKTTNKQNRISTVLLFDLAYLAVGILFAVLANSSGTSGIQALWRWAVFLISCVVFAVYIEYEHFRLYNPPRSAALHISLAVALGAFAITVAANLQALGNPGNHGSIDLALVIWPIATMIPAFLVALAAATLLTRKGPIS